MWRRNDAALLMDSYELTMLQAYLDHGFNEMAVFEFFARKLPDTRNYLVSAGLEQVLEYLENLRFSDADITTLRNTGRYSENLLDYLSRFRFTGDVWAIPEGTPVFANEPLLRVEAPIPEAQLVETRIINLLQLETVIASKAARCVTVAEGRLLIDFGVRRAHGAEAGVLAARASYLAGFHGTSTVLAGAVFHIPVFGTMAHSFIEAHDREKDAFLAFAESHPKNAFLLIDTYDTEEGARKVVELAPLLRGRGFEIHGVRLDSGDLFEHARAVRAILNQGGLSTLRIFASGSIDEFMIRDLVSRGAPIDGFGVGTHLTTSEDAPYLDCAYKLQQYAGVPRFKTSEEKSTVPGAKQVYRFFEPDGTPAYDTVTLATETSPGIPLLQRFMTRGKRIQDAAPLAYSRELCLREVARLPTELRSVVNPHSYPVLLSDELRGLGRSVA